MTATQFVQRVELGLIQADEPVRTIIFRHPGGTEWQEVFVREAYNTIANQEAEFRAKVGGFCDVISPYRPHDTVPAKNWRM